VSLLRPATAQQQAEVSAGRRVVEVEVWRRSVVYWRGSPIIEPSAEVEPKMSVCDGLRPLRERAAKAVVVERTENPIGFVTVRALIEPLIGETMTL